MKINWKVRLQSKTFLLAAFAFLLMVAQEGAKLLGYEITEVVSERATTFFNSILTILVLAGVVHDPTTKGLSDSEQALGYNKPRDELEDK